MPMWVKSFRYPVPAFTSTSTSGRSTRGSIRSTVSRNAVSVSGSGTASSRA